MRCGARNTQRSDPMEYAAEAAVPGVGATEWHCLRCRKPNGVPAHAIGTQKMRPLAWLVALAKRSWTSAQLTTFQNALT